MSNKYVSNHHSSHFCQRVFHHSVCVHVFFFLYFSHFNLHKDVKLCVDNLTHMRFLFMHISPMENESERYCQIFLSAREIERQKNRERELHLLQTKYFDTLNEANALQTTNESLCALRTHINKIKEKKNGTLVCVFDQILTDYDVNA